MKNYNALMKTAEVYAQESYCKKKKVGCVAAIDGRSIITAYNGTVSGAENCCEQIIDGVLKTNHDEVVHCEQNLIAFAAKYGIKLMGATMFITLSPCMQCAKLIIQAGISEVIYLEEYKDIRGIYFLRKHGVVCKKFKKHRSFQ